MIYEQSRWSYLCIIYVPILSTSKQSDVKQLDILLNQNVWQSFLYVYEHVYEDKLLIYMCERKCFLPAERNNGSFVLEME